MKQIDINQYENDKIVFRATLFAIHMIQFRIDTIKENVSDIIEVPQ